MNRIILIGNGFDLAHGLATRYKDFIADFWERQIEEVKNSKDWKNGRNFSNKFINVTYNKNFDFNKLKDDCTYKIGFLKTIVGAFAQNWCDIETIYFKELVKLKDNFDKTKPHEKQEIETLNYEFDQIEGELKEYLIRESKKKSLIDENHNLHPDFEKNLQNEIKNIIFNFEYPKNYTKRKFTNAKDEEILLLSFNYTKTAELYKQSNVIVNNIHGKLDKAEHPIIFGYGDEETDDSKQIEKLEVNEFLKKVKSVKYNKTSHYSQLEHFILQEDQPYEVFVFGHSCANCDRTLLNMLFENKNCESIRIFYNKADKNSFFDIYCNVYRQFVKEKKNVKNKVECEVEAIPLPSKAIIKPYILDYFLEEIKIPNEDFEYTLIGNNKKQTIKKSFYISKYQVKQKQYESIMGKNPSYFKGEDLPVESINWYHAIAFCNKLSKKYELEEVYSVKEITNWESLNYEDIPDRQNKKQWKNIEINTEKSGFRLPTETEWEFAATSGGKYKESDKKGSEDEKEGKYLFARNTKTNNLDLLGWHSENSYGRTHPVGQKQPNELGLYDMSGNVWEWCEDWHDDKTRCDRMARGSSWNDLAWGCRVSLRDFYEPSYRNNFIGFRLACSL